MYSPYISPFIVGATSVYIGTYESKRGKMQPPPPRVIMVMDLFQPIFF